MKLKTHADHEHYDLTASFHDSRVIDSEHSAPDDSPIRISLVITWSLAIASLTSLAIGVFFYMN